MNGLKHNNSIKKLKLSLSYSKLKNKFINIGQLLIENKLLEYFTLNLEANSLSGFVPI